MFIPSRRFLALIAAACSILSAQTDRVRAPIDAGQSVVLRGSVHPQARAENDQGAVEAGFPISGITFILTPSAAQKAALQQLLAQQQDPASPNYHRWLTPEQYADAYGVTAADMNKIAAWLKLQGFAIDNTARSRTFISFSGTAEQTGGAFHTAIHRYLVNGRMHYANTTDPSIPLALSGVVSGIRGLHDFHLQPRLKFPSHPEMTNGGAHQLAPGDIATIYDIAPLYAAGVDGTGQKIAVAGQTDINVSDIQKFRAQFGLSAPNLTQVLAQRPDPGISSGDLPEADLDIEWSGAVAKNAEIIYVYSNDVVQSAYYAIDQAIAPVLTMSYGGCEQADLVDLPTFQAMAQQANAEGMTWLNAAGDNGAADCEDQGAAIAQDGLAVDAPGSIPEITSMGGSEFSELGGKYWASSNTNGASALGYIPETVWNDSGFGQGLMAGGGGGSIFFPQPGWQTGPGVPNDGARHVPDLALSASPDHDGYYFYSAGSSGYVGGTSVSSPVMAGIVALLNHYLVSTGAQSRAGLGNINPSLYRLAQSTTGIFHDITTGNNSVVCVIGSPNCATGSIGMNAGPGYDQATGLGSVDAFNLAHGWSSTPPANSAVTVSLDQNPVFQQTPDAAGNPWHFTLTLTEEAGIPTTLTDLTVNGVNFISKIKTSISAHGVVSATIGLSNIAVPANVAFVVNGIDASGTRWAQQLSIPFSGPQIPLTVAGIANGASFQPVFAPGMIVSVFGTQLGDFVQSFGTVPLPQYLAGFEATVNGVPAPLYYVSPNQVNLQIPYETQPGSATLTVGNPYMNVDYKFQVAASAPGIFTGSDGSIVPFPSAARNQTITLYITGDGQVSPSLPTGTAPAAGTPTSRLPKPRLSLSVSVGGVSAPTTFVGIPTGYVGVTQINFTVPANAPVGAQPVIVTVGNAASAAAKLTVQ